MSDEERAREDRVENRRWHEEVRGELKKIHEALADLASSEHPMQKRVRALEDNQSRLIGALILIQFLGAFAILFLNKLIGVK